MAKALKTGDRVDWKHEICAPPPNLKLPTKVIRVMGGGFVALETGKKGVHTTANVVCLKKVK